jgi:hypothetical protein
MSNEERHKFQADQIKKRDLDVKYSKHSMRKAYKMLVGKPEEYKSLCCSRVVGENYIKVDLKVRVGEGVDWIYLARDRAQGLAL